MKIKVIELAQVPTKYSFLREEEQKNLMGGDNCTPYSKKPCYWYITCGVPPTELSQDGPAYSTDGGTTCSDYYTDKEWCIRR